MRSFKEGELVEVIDDNVTGVIITISNDLITIRTQDGFDMDFSASELMHREGLNHIRVSNAEVATAKADKEQPGKPKIRKVRNMCVI